MTRPRRRAHAACLAPVLAALPLLAGCAATDPLTRTGVWRPNYANDANLRLSVSNPDDLMRGQSESGASGQRSVTAVDRMLQGKLGAPPLQSGMTEISPTQGGS